MVHTTLEVSSLEELRSAFVDWLTKQAAYNGSVRYCRQWSERPSGATFELEFRTTLLTHVASFLESRFGTSAAIVKAHETEEQRPIETLFDVVTAATAYSKTLSHQDARIKVERIAGDILQKLAPSKLSIVSY